MLTSSQVGYKRPVNAVSVGSHRRGNKQLGCTYGERFNFFLSCNMAWGHLISWYKQTYGVSPSAVENYIASLIHLIYICRAKVLLLLTLNLKLS